MMILNKKLARRIAMFLVIEFSFSIFFPTVTMALTGGPNAPEFSSFTPVATTDMVNLFTGDFNYNLPVIEIPGADGGGYALSLSYNSGNTSEQEASWVGFGWSLNPGSINRNVRGFPDDYNGNQVDFYNKSRPNWTASAGRSVGLEAFSVDVPIGVSISSSLRFNNHQGYTKNLGLGLRTKGVSLGLNFDNEGTTFSANIDFSAFLNKSKDKGTENADNNTSEKEDKQKAEKDQSVKQDKETFKQKREELRKSLDIKTIRTHSPNVGGSSYGLGTYSEVVRATSLTEYDGRMFNWSASKQFNTVIPVGIEKGSSGSFSLQYNKYKNPIAAYGYSHSDKATKGDIMDYYLEKGSAFTKRDNFIGMPFNNYDIFSLSGEGLSGGFRSYNRQIGHYSPNYVRSKISIFQLGYEVMVGANLGVGVDFGIGRQSSEIYNWNVANRKSFSDSDVASNQVFRFNDDLGGSFAYTSSTELESGRVNTSGLYGFRSAKATAPEADVSRGGNFTLGSENGRSSYIEQKYESDQADKNIIGFNVYNEDGLKYSYDEPLFVRNETNLSVDISKTDDKEWRYLAFRDLKLSDNSGGYEISKTDLESNQFTTAVGEIRKDEYANNFLLKTICTPDYIDKTGDGTSQDDFGGWTSFNYRKVYGKGQSQWYRYRTPYNGLLYQQNAISDTKDDIGSVVTGQKEVTYLETIETNTHIAYFVTNKSTNDDIAILNGSNKTRFDGLGAKPLDSSEDPASKKSVDGEPIRGTTELEFLEKVVLFPKDVDGNVNYDKPLKTVHFDYEWNLVPNVPNNKHSTYTYSDNSPNNTSEDSGKLTLTKVWFEYGGIIPAKISPYEFGYSYKHSSTVRDEYAGLFSEYDELADNIQNPSYSPHLLSPWGYPMANGKERKENDIPWIDQGYELEGEQNFDPAAWQLKSVKLPSGGEILIQYEEKDYTHVQNRDAMAMASIVDTGDSESGYSSNPEYAINPEDLGVDPSNLTQVQALANKINLHFKDDENVPDKKIYFKFLYALKGENPSLDDCRSDYLTGYANFMNAEARVQGTKNVIFITLANNGEDRASIPRQACYELVSNTKQGKLSNTQCVETNYEGRYDTDIARAADNGQEGDLGAVKGLALKTITRMAFDPQVLFFDVDKESSVCKVISPEHSFLKLPMAVAKKGGGVRVKRLLMYDQGIELGDEAVYGSEYLYVTEDGETSSGVATTEPSAAREENPLVTFLPKKDHVSFGRITAGEEREQTEGPIGETLLPAASIGYSRVITKNIHTGKTGTGYSVNEFYTAKDFPFDGHYGSTSPTDEDDDKFDISGKGSLMTSIEDQTVTDNLDIPAGLFTYSTSKVWTAQGFRFVLNNMHGQMKKVTNYGGSYLTSANDGYQVSFQEYEYYQPGEKVKMLEWDDVNNSFKEYYDTPGKEMDIAMEAKRLKNVTIDFNIEVDISITIALPPPVFVTLIPSFAHMDESIATHATTKVLRYPAILKSMTSGQDGVVSSTENLAFSKATGQSIIRRTTDSFHKLNLAGSGTAHDGSIYSMSLPAEWIYPEMGQKAVDITNTNELMAQTATFSTYGVEPSPNWFLSPTNLLSASAQTFSKDWNSSWTDARINDEYGSSAAASQLNEIWRPEASWIYKSDDATSIASEKIYKSGYFDMNNMFDWTAANQTDNNWIKTSEVSKYSPNGSVLEERNALNIASTALFGNQYGNHLPVMVAQNAEYNSVYFEDFENQGHINTKNHSGKGSKSITHGEIIVDGVYVTPQLIDKGGLFYVWLNFESGEQESDLKININGNQQDLLKIASTGEWSLFKSEIPGSTFNTIGDGSPLTIRLESTGSFSQIIYGDDVRFQPRDAEASCYVYDDKTFRLIAQYDSEHFGLYYQYNEEGQLVRKIIETERGLKTIQETQYNTKKQNRPL